MKDFLSKCFMIRSLEFLRGYSLSSTCINFPSIIYNGKITKMNQGNRTRFHDDIHYEIKKK